MAGDRKVTSSYHFSSSDQRNHFLQPSSAPYPEERGKVPVDERLEDQIEVSRNRSDDQMEIAMPRSEKETGCRNKGTGSDPSNAISDIPTSSPHRKRKMKPQISSDHPVPAKRGSTSSSILGTFDSSENHGPIPIAKSSEDMPPSRGSELLKNGAHTFILNTLSTVNAKTGKDTKRDMKNLLIAIRDHLNAELNDEENLNPSVGAALSIQNKAVSSGAAYGLNAKIASIHKPGVTPTHYDAMCEKSYSTGSKLREHLRADHVLYLVTFRCPEKGCKSFRKQKHALRAHVQSAHSYTNKDIEDIKWEEITN